MIRSSSLLVLVALGCGPGTPAPAPQPVAPHEPAAVPVGGTWSWLHLVERGDIRTIEHERWRLQTHGEHVSGAYRRTVIAQALDGSAFSCSQAASYQIVADYRIEGTRDATSVELHETDYGVAPSPCDRGWRRLTSYRGRVIDGALVLEWDGGRQTLRPDGGAEAGAPAPAGVEGPWRWATRMRQADGFERTEHEAWHIEEDRGLITGTYSRTVTVFDPGGGVIDCSGDSSFQFRDRYQVRGVRSQNRVDLAEVAVEPGTHPCLDGDERHLDGAVGELSGDLLILDWRGGRRQVLHRPPP